MKSWAHRTEVEHNHDAVVPHRKEEQILWKRVLQDDDDDHSMMMIKDCVLSELWLDIAGLLTAVSGTIFVRGT